MPRHFITPDGLVVIGQEFAISAHQTGARVNIRWSSISNVLNIVSSSSNHADGVLLGTFGPQIGTVQDVEFYATVNMPQVQAAVSGPYTSIYFLARHGNPIEFSGFSPSTGYKGHLVRSTGSSGTIRIARGPTGLGSVAWATYPANVRFQLAGTHMRARIWSTGTAEPVAWTLAVTDGTFASGLASLGTEHAPSASGFTIPTTTNTMNGLGIHVGGTNAPTAGGLATITGQVRLAGVAQSGATVIACRHNAAFTRPLIPGIDVVKATTDASGNFTLTLNTDDTPYHVEARFLSGGAWHCGSVVAASTATGVVIELRPGRVTRARRQGSWFTDVWDRTGGLWVKR